MYLILCIPKHFILIICILNISGGSKLITIRIFKKKHPFAEDPITGPVDTKLFDKYLEWIRKGLLVMHENKKNNEDRYRKKMEAFENDADYTYNVGITVVENKNWFYQLSMSGQLWNDEHIDVIFYYLRKKGKYDRRSTFKYTTVDCLFMRKVDQTYLTYNNPETGSNVANEEDDLCQYVKGYRLHANVPWHSVDNIFIPINIKEDNHWILVVLSFNDRRLYVYNSYRGSTDHNAVVRREVQKLAALLPHYLHISGLYTQKTGMN
ncbi:uncharacterized protein LOC132610266 [Lycium barbarum]|uniref:uncharacterized protein LOC132610266 n=1 Tax=Lycium barbarum TaxID=112863 RepID=UPI00293F252D|nr:uncharacterized protein LOC132610266 [Lycium barbarum]